MFTSQQAFRNFHRQYQDDSTRPGLVADIQESIEDGTIRASDVSIQHLFRGIFGEEVFMSMMTRKSGGRRFTEVMEASGDAVNTGDFANITGQFLYNRMMEGYNYPQALWPMLCENYKTTLLNGERIPGVGEFGYGGIDVVGEGERFPLLGPNEQWLDTPPLNKRGFICEITRECIMQDQTGLIVKRAADGGKWLSMNKDIRVIQCATGYLNNYSRNGISTNTFLTSGAYINTASVPLVNWQSVQTVELLFANITDPNTGAPIIIESPQLLVPNGLKRTANFVMQSSNVAMVDNTPTPDTVRTYGSNPVANGFWGGSRPDVVSNSFVGNTAVTGGSSNNNTAWYMGDFRKAILYKEAFGVEVTQAMPNSPEAFYRDIMAGWKFVEMGVPVVVEPRFIAKGNA